MGSFNVSCSMSNLSIGWGDKVLFFILMPNAYRDQHLIQPGSTIIHPNDYFNLFSLPIEGEYDSYGRLENIVETDNVKLLEKFFCAPMSVIIDCISQDRGWSESFGPISRQYMLNYNLIRDYDVKFNEDFLKALGFEKKEDSFEKEGLSHGVRFIEAGKSHEKTYEIYNLESGEVFDIQTSYSCDEKEPFLEDIYAATGVMLNIDPDHQAKIELLVKLSGMFVLKPIYDSFVSFKQDNSYYEKELDEFYELLPKIKDTKSKIEKLKAIANRRRADNLPDDIEMNKYFELKIFLMSAKPFERFSSNGAMHTFGPHPYVEELYRESFENGHFKQDLSDLYRFYMTAYSCNRIFFPALTGEQCGNTDASLMLLNASLAICNERKADEDDDYYDDDDSND